MRTSFYRFCLYASLVGVTLVACSRLPHLPERPPPLDGEAGRGGDGSGDGGGQGGAGGEQAVELVTYPATGAGQALRVAQFELKAGGAQGLDRATVVLVRGEVSDVALRGLAKGEPPKSLLERVVPSLVMPLEGGSLVVAPRVPLEEGAYTVAAGSAMWRKGVEVAGGAGLPILGRLWPPAAGGAAPFGVYCADTPLPKGLRVEAGPGPAVYELRPGVVDDARAERCVTLFANGVTGEVPAALRLFEGGTPVAMIDPNPLTPGQGETSAPAPASCSPPATALGPLCCEVLDDRVVLRPGASPVLALVEAGAAFTASAFAGAPVVLRGLRPSTPTRVGARWFDTAGVASEAAIEVTTGPARPHVVINEVLADALGPEPASEWIELVNDGDSSVELGGWLLADGGGEVALPPYELAAGAFVVLTAEGFEPGAGGDVAPLPSAGRLTLPSLGKSGLSNAGEALTLRPPGGEVVSAFPAAPKPKAGSSIARRRPDTPDDDAGGFFVSAPRGATPGGPNVPPESE
jgi:lamin tail-like protein